MAPAGRLVDPAEAGAPGHRRTRFPPWSPFDRAAARQAVAATGRHAPADLTWILGRSPLDLTVYSDGALREKRAGAGFCVFRGPTTEIAAGSLSLGQLATIYDAGVVAAVAGVQAALSRPMAAFATDLTACLDNEKACHRDSYGARVRGHVFFRG